MFEGPFGPWGGGRIKKVSWTGSRGMSALVKGQVADAICPGGMAVVWRGVDRTEGALGGRTDRIWYAGVDRRDGQDNLRLPICESKCGRGLGSPPFLSCCPHRRF